MSRSRRGDRLYALLLHVLPDDLRGRYGEDMRRLLRSRLAEARGTGARIRLWAGAVLDVLAVGASARLAHLGPRRARPSGLAHAARTLARRPGFAASAVLTMALALGMLTSVWAVLDATVLRPLPYPDGDRLASVNGKLVTRRMIEAWERDAPVVEAATPWSLRSGVLRGSVETVRVREMLVGERFFELLGPHPIRGRVISAADFAPGAAPTAVVSASLWDAVFGGGAAPRGQVIEIDGASFSVVGVIPDDFQFMLYRGVQVWRPLPRETLRPSALVRLAPGTSFDAARDALVEFSVARAEDAGLALATDDPPVRMHPIREMVVGGVRGSLWTLAAAAALVLLIACANVSSLFLARAEERRDELATRRALGATRADLVRSVLSEALVVAVGGGTLGILAAPWILRLLLSMGAGYLPGLNEIQVDGRVALFAGVASLVATMLAGALPSLVVAMGGGTGGASRSTTPGRRTARFLAGLVHVEVTIAMVLIVGVGLLSRTFLALYPTDPGFEPDGKAVIRMELPSETYVDRARRVSFVDELERATRGLPGAPVGAVSSLVPFANVVWVIPVDAVDGREPGGGVDDIHFRAATPGYLDVLGTSILEGRGLSASDRAGALEDGWAAAHHTVMLRSTSSRLTKGRLPRRSCWRIQNLMSAGQ